jgi:hypothetical protein
MSDDQLSQEFLNSVSNLFGDDREWAESRERRKAAGAAVEAITSIGDLRSLRVDIEERMKALAAEILEPGSDKLIYDLHALDYIWDLSGDRVTTVGKPYNLFAIDAYLGRKVEHVWGIGEIAKMEPSPDAKGKRWDGSMYGIKVELPCGRCEEATSTLYARPGCHAGAFCYLYTPDGTDHIDLRNFMWVCEDCR